MTTKICFLLAVFAYTSFVSAQDQDTFNALYTKTFLETSQEDFPRALHVADSLYTLSETPLLKARSLMLTASLYQQASETIKAIEYALKAEEIINKTDNVNWKTRIYGFLATQYRIAQLFTPAKAYVEKALIAAENIKDKKTADATKGLVMQEMAYYEMAHKQYEQAITYLRKSAQYLEDAQQTQSFAVVENEQLLGLTYYLSGDEEKALQHYEVALNLSTKLPDNHVTALVHNGLANIYFNRTDLSNAEQHLDIARRIADRSPYLHLKKEINETAYRYYSNTEDVNKMLTIKKTQDSIVTAIYRQSADFLNSSYTTLGREREDIRRESNSKLIFFLMGILIVLPFTFYFFFPRSKPKSTPSPVIRARRNESQNKEEEPPSSMADDGAPPSDVNPDDESTSTPVMPEQTINRILTLLAEFEDKQLYLKRDLSLSYLATYCDTNAKYLSVVINSHKKKDFFNYINELRINYIIEKLRNDPYYPKLKIAVLAREAGFSSQSKFALNFKKVTDVSPSEFIKSLAESSEED